MKKRIIFLTVLCVVLLLALTGCSKAGNVVSNAASKIGEDVSNAVSRVESFFEGDDASSALQDDTLSSRLDDGVTSSGTLDESFNSSGLMGDDLGSGSSAMTKDVQ